MVRLLISLEPRQAQEEVAQSLMNLMRCAPARPERHMQSSASVLMRVRAGSVVLLGP